VTGASKNTVVKLLVDLGIACAAYQDRVMRDLPRRSPRTLRALLGSSPIISSRPIRVAAGGATAWRNVALVGEGFARELGKRFTVRPSS